MSLGNRIYAGDIQESYHFVKYNGDQNRLVIYADDVVPRWVVAGCLLDYHTVAGADKFGNIFILRLPANATDDIDDDPSGIAAFPFLVLFWYCYFVGAKVVWQRGLLSGAPQKLECLVNYHVGELVVSLQKVTLVAGGGECLIYTTIRGTIGVLAPFTTREDVDFFQILEMHMQHKYPPLCGRDHLSYRSFYFPRKNVVDGDLTEQFNILPSGTKEEIASETTRTAVEVSKKLEDMRARFAF
ncbi:hypothetical protein Zmor_004276 [Zophobas morio]|uniref:RSE1/DDB1/CPSF1 C-terminal domain-containing protein n=1 Tax=Zophobas morio TaxID=2755281 RepID=A0AA38HKQ9_9CUCU|nr:hypothetical protein Zmor_004276 [Zophobas morio]